MSSVLNRRKKMKLEPIGEILAVKAVAQVEVLNWRTFKFFTVSATALSGFSTCNTNW